MKSPEGVIIQCLNYHSKLNNLMYEVVQIQVNIKKRGNYKNMKKGKLFNVNITKIELEKNEI